MTSYAQNTNVSCEKSRAEIEMTLRRFGAERFLSGWDPNEAYIAFSYRGRAVRITLPLPPREQFLRTPKRRELRSDQEVERAWEQACRENWRALALMVKAKLVGVERGIATLEGEFLAYTVLPEGQTVGEWLEPQMQTLIQTGRMPQRLLPAGPPQTKPVESTVVNRQS